MTEPNSDVYTSYIIVESPQERVRLTGPREVRHGPSYKDGACMGGSWACLPSTGSAFRERVAEIMKLGFYPYASGKYGRVISVELFLNDEPITFEGLGR